MSTISHTIIPSPELTEELAEMLTEVAAGGTAGYAVELPADVDTVAALSVLEQLGYVYKASLDDVEKAFITISGREVLEAREAAREAALRQELVDSYAAVAAELRAIADAIDTMPVDGLSKLTIEVRIASRYWDRERASADAVNVATVDAVAAVLGLAPTTERLGVSDTWKRAAEARRGPINVVVTAFVDDPTAREREAAEQARQDEMERLRAELAEAKRQLAGAEVAE